MKARLLLGLCALLVFPGCFDSIVGSQCAKGYSRCGKKCVVTGTCTLPDAGIDAEDQEAGLVDWPDTSEADDLASDATDDVEPLADAEDHDAEAGLPTEIDSGAPDLDVDGPKSSDGDVDSSSPTLDSSPTNRDDAESFDTAVDAPQPSPDATSDTWVAPDLASHTDVSDDGLDCPDCDGGVDAPALDVGVPAVDGADAGDGDDDALDWSDADDAQDDALEAEAGPLVCEGSLTACGGECVDTNSNPLHCRECDNACPSEECISGVCLECDPGETVCHDSKTCADTASDPDNCGDCGNICPSGLCSSGECEAAAVGRVIVIGHDYSYSNLDKNRILSNAVFLWRRLSTVRLLTYRGSATDPSIQGTRNAIVPGPNQEVIETLAEDDTVPSLLPSADVFIINAQAGATDLKLNQLGAAWAESLMTFVKDGRTIIVLDGDQSFNAGTVQILASAGLFNLTRQSSASASTVKCNITASGDFLVAGTSNKTGYACRYFSTTFAIGTNTNEDSTPADITTVVEAVVGDAGSAPVIVRRTF